MNNYLTTAEAEGIGRRLNGAGRRLVMHEMQFIDSLLEKLPLDDDKVILITHRQLLRECCEAYHSRGLRTLGRNLRAFFAWSHLAHTGHGASPLLPP